MTGLRALLWNPIVAKEVFSRMRSWRSAAVIAAYLATLSTAAYLAYRPYGGSIGGIDEARRLSLAGTAVFSAVGGTVLGLVALIVPGLVGSTISGERERQTLDLLLCTPVRPARIVIGKLVSSLLFVLLLVVASAPVFAVVFLLGGVSAGQVVEVLLVCLVTAVIVGSLAMLCSVLMRRGATAIVAGYVLTALLLALPNLTPLFAPARPTTGYTGYVPLGGGASGPGGSAAMGGGIVTAPGAPRQGPAVKGQIPSGVSYGGFSSVAVARGGTDVPWPALMSPVTTGVVTLGAVSSSQSSIDCGAGQYCGGAATRDILSDGPFAGWHAWEVMILADLALAGLVLTLSVLILRGRLPRALRRQLVAPAGPA